MINERKLEKINELSNNGIKHRMAISEAIDEEFTLALKSGAIYGLVSSNKIVISKEWIKSFSEGVGFTNSTLIASFWEKVSEVSGGKKIGLTYDDWHLENHYNCLEDFLNEEFVDIEDSIVFGALLDMDKTTKYFSKKSVEDLRFNIDYGVFDENFDEYMKSTIEDIICDSIKMPAGWTKWLVKMNKSNPSLVKPTNKMDLMVWIKQMKDIKITQKNYTSFIKDTLSDDKSILDKQTGFISRKITKGTMNQQDVPKWAYVDMYMTCVYKLN